MYDYVIVTHLPAFYKVNLYNELFNKLNIYVIFIANNTYEKRANDFVSLDNCNFKYEILNDGDFQTRNKFKSIINLNKILKIIDYKRILVSGWDLIEFWYLVFKNPNKKNCLALESTVFESNTKGLKGLIKKIFLSNISTVFASGKLHVELLKELDYKKEIKITKGVGIINKPMFEKKEKEYKKRFLFVGRISSEKNLKLIIEIFNESPKYTLTIVGKGPQELELKSISKPNIIFYEPIENKKLNEIFSVNDILILPSVSETWGLVVEEALYFGLPVIVSENCGSSELVENAINGFVVNPYSSDDIKKTILKIDDEIYSELVERVKIFSIKEKDISQVKVYVD